jgi:membrane associated rhomboid family serine protease
MSSQESDHFSPGVLIKMRRTAVVLACWLPVAATLATVLSMPSHSRVPQLARNSLLPQSLSQCSHQDQLVQSTHTRSPAHLMSSVSTASDRQGSAVYGLILVNIGIFLGDKLLRIAPLKALYLYHYRWQWWQPLTSCFCHASRSHLSGNLFLLLLFGRSVEDELGWAGLLFTYAFCGVLANALSLVLLPSSVVSVGASGAVFGLFAVSVLSRLSMRELEWRRVVEVAVLGDFVIGRVVSEVATAASGGVAGINHVAHLGGAGAGVLMVLLLRGAIAKMEGGQRSRT